MDTRFLWPTLLLVVVHTTWASVSNLRALDRGTKPRATVFGCIAQWAIILAAVYFGYRTASFVGVLVVAAACLVLPVASNIIVAILKGRVVRNR